MMKYIFNIEEIKSFLLMNNHFYSFVTIIFLCRYSYIKFKLYYFKVSI